MATTTIKRPTTPAAQVAWTATAVEILSDGKWHDRDEVLEAMAPTIPAGYAVERFRYYMPADAKRNNALYARARRFVAGHAMRNLQRNGAVEYDQAKGRYRRAWTKK